ncbi:hypothetical protein HER10_EVM0009737 [Colletotrichum scovillei]|uniref:Uncharacterized protein n=1 Tax=Colletotrichum scovillei TaxID=1209932 RepID=A0A9P7QV05_9PEZI|nr:uncharacterized protein HER10_EVM0009737 [Colletotrichum scovillei]KAF4778736.1 hypothetical protein HER10_EVM0009737 [Colletotrichum scovillei]KAG7043652.1 hypothetical protein JMJ77_0011474 [Colletotrichum scovillei]KAG7045754.1 hypothetical protein JMJ78_0010825 [Colletotrichum scovillei]KAG7063101.1 hypothetical protein JMJ76_0005569 [Colletotrichum scovillei]
MTESHDTRTASGNNNHGVAAMDAVAKPSHNARRHKPSASLGSLYEVLADLDDNQLQYLIQEMNHTGHQNVPVSQAVSTFEALKSSSSPLDPFAVSETGTHAPAPDSPAREPLRNLSKSRRGRLSLQTAFQRAPSLKHRQRQQQQQQQSNSDSPRDDYLFRSSTFSQGPEPVQSHRPAKGYGELLSSPVSSCSSPAGGPVVMSGLPEPATVTRPTRYEEIEVPQPASQPLPSPPPSASSYLEHQPTPPPPPQPQVQQRRPSTNGARMGPPAYHRIPRPDFNLPEGVTVTDLLHLLEIEYMSSNRQASSSSRRSSSSSTSSSISRPSLSSPSPSSPALATRLFPPPSRSFSQTPNLHGRSPLRRSSSRLDLALGAERSASGAAEIGMGMLEPRQLRSVSLGFPGGGMATTMSMDSLSRSLKGETRPPAPAPVFEGIFDVLENQ